MADSRRPSAAVPKFLAHQRGNIGFQDVAEEDLQILVSGHRLGKDGLERGIDLDRKDLLCGPAKLVRKRPDARADLQNAAALIDAGGLDDLTRDPALRQEILSLRLGKMEAVARRSALMSLILQRSIKIRPSSGTVIVPNGGQFFNSQDASAST